MSYLKRFKENWPIVIAPTIVLLLSLFLVSTFFECTIGMVVMIEDPYAATLALIVLLCVLIKLVSWLGLNVLSNWANAVNQALTKK